jgi:hypothetical protein
MMPEQPNDNLPMEMLAIIEREAEKVCAGVEGANPTNIVCMLALQSAAVLLSVGLQGEENTHFVIQGGVTRADVVNTTLKQNGVDYYLSRKQ